MKTAILALLTSISFGMTGLAQETEPTLVGYWKVNWETTAPTIGSVHGALKDRFATLGEFRDFLAKQLDGMTLEIQPDSKGFVRYAPDFKASTFRWRTDQKGQSWIDELSSGARHGFKSVDAKRATLLFQVKVDTNSSIRIPVLAERQPKPPETDK